jgi:hypothetical protein
MPRKTSPSRRDEEEIQRERLIAKLWDARGYNLCRNDFTGTYSICTVYDDPVIIKAENLTLDKAEALLLESD